MELSEAARQRLRGTFDEDAELYDKARPHYPHQLFDDLIQLASLKPGGRLLEIGCGTGRATVPLARLGFRILGVELGENMAAIARRNLAPFSGVRVEVTPFESWDSGGQMFDLAFCAQVWHWLDPDVRYRKAADLLKPFGFLAIVDVEHAFPQDADPFFFDVQDIYRAIGEEHPDEEWPPPLPEDVPDFREEIEATGLFGDFHSRRYAWEVMYAADEYIDLLNTFSGHIAMQPEKRDFLYRNVRERINARLDPRVRRHWLAILNVARKL